MKGLLKNNFYGVIENLKIALAFVMLVGVLLLITGEMCIRDRLWVGQPCGKKPGHEAVYG